MGRMSDAQRLGTLAGAGSAALLMTALVFQAAGYAPCELCILQRWPHVAAAILGALVWVLGSRRPLMLLGVLAAAVATALAVYHSGVELKWWPGPSACSGGVADLGQLSPADLVRRLNAAPLVRCDVPAWRMFGLTMANLNAVASAVLTGIWALAAVGMRRPG